MMKRAPILHTYGDVTITCYYMDAGEEIPRHQHPWPHTTAVYAGRTRVDIFGVLHSQCVMTVGDPDITLPSNIDHLITALDDRTLVVNVTVGRPAPPDPGPPAADGSVMMADGSVVQP